ncbi:hypothetical protein DM01DRAFT_115605 [Hesseltinella vesiculosa]|uniref:Uncharacterized protein n=1 Tax=Hesseltinella vesiculosa TaxID=101127 RepID=A0A1X2GFV3_9FUNG|nr:hypothetical protein DM01DRAFT_115605 [Hesseltinella vesiculosa]
MLNSFSACPHVFRETSGLCLSILFWSVCQVLIKSSAIESQPACSSSSHSSLTPIPNAALVKPLPHTHISPLLRLSYPKKKNRVINTRLSLLFCNVVGGCPSQK